MNKLGVNLIERVWPYGHCERLDDGRWSGLKYLVILLTLQSYGEKWLNLYILVNES